MRKSKQDLMDVRDYNDKIADPLRQVVIGYVHLRNLSTLTS
jgi:hypothetical protein